VTFAGDNKTAAAGCTKHISNFATSIVPTPFYFLLVTMATRAGNLGRMVLS
jgi:hypothetical protein